MSAKVLGAVGIQKRYTGVRALNGADFNLATGEVHVLPGENGAGKSTLMGVLSGTVNLDRQQIAFANPREAHAAGIAMIPQELNFVAGLDIAAKLSLGNEITRSGGGGVLANRAMRRRAQDLLARTGVSLDAELLVSNVRIGERQLVAIAKALSAGARILIMDEPAVALSPVEADYLVAVVRKLAGRSVGIVYIPHMLKEEVHTGDRVPVTRDVAVVGTVKPGTPRAELVRMLVGRPLADLFPSRATKIGAPILRLEHAAVDPKYPRAGWQAPVDVSFAGHEGGSSGSLDSWTSVARSCSRPCMGSAPMRIGAIRSRCSAKLSCQHSASTRRTSWSCKARSSSERRRGIVMKGG